ncbi:MAG TPA: hypothetical protein VH592_13865 [Gemmataceae bacterium]|jgi:hypothetical protein
MQITVLIEPVAGNGYRARGGEPLPLVVEAPTREEALAKLKEQLQARLRNGAEIVALDLTPAKHPWMEFAGMFKDNPLLEEWKKDMARYRRKIDAEADKP